MMMDCFKIISKIFPELIEKNNENINQGIQPTALESKPEFLEYDVEL
jgi:hypothetical protein